MVYGLYIVLQNSHVNFHNYLANYEFHNNYEGIYSMSDLQDIIAQSTIRAYNAGFEAGKTHVMSAVKFVTFEHYDLEVAAIADLEEELRLRAKNE